MDTYCFRFFKIYMYAYGSSKPYTSQIIFALNKLITSFFMGVYVLKLYNKHVVSTNRLHFVRQQFTTYTLTSAMNEISITTM